MTQPSSRRRSRQTRTERAQHLYTARTDEPIYENRLTEPEEPAYEPNEADGYEAYQPNEEPAEEYADYLPNEEYPEEYADYTPNEEPSSAYAAYYSREGAAQEGAAEPAFAPPPRMQAYGFEQQASETENDDEYAYAAGNVYRPRQVTWAEEDREEAIAESELGYQVQEEAQPARRKPHTLRILLIAAAMLAVLAAALWLMREPIAEKLGISVFGEQPTATPMIAMTTPEPVKAYDAAPASDVSDAARVSIARLSGTLPMENHIVTDQHIVSRSPRADGSWDYYLFTAEGRLLCYFEGLTLQDMIPQEFGGFYVRQAPWLVTAGGSALIRTADVEAAIQEPVFLHPMYRGWAVVESETDGHANYVNAEGKLMSSLWFSRTFPFTADYTLAYVDTGSTAEASERYLLYVIGTDGSMTRWLVGGSMEDVVACVSGMAYMADGFVYHLPDTSAPAFSSPEITAYPDCDAMVVCDPQTGKYGLYVHGEKHYDYVYDSIRPLDSDLVWAEKTLGDEDAWMTLKAVSGAPFPQPLSYSFVLEKDGANEYVALSAGSSYPMLLDGEF